MRGSGGRDRISRWALTILLLGAGAWPAAAATQQHALPFVPTHGRSIEVDGVLDEPVWEDAAVARDFVQLRPDEGAPPSQATEARVLFGPDALYVAIRAWDRSPDSIVGILHRRDEESPSDWVQVLIDSYHDRRTGFLFAVNAAGVKRDVLYYDDTARDAGWDAVWEVATRVDGEGWTAEFRIPYSQLRFTGEDGMTWGINFGREIGRLSETSFWAPLSLQDNRVVSRAGVVTGIRGLQPPRRIEVQPYTVVRAQRAPGEASNPFHRATDWGTEVGADLKIGVTNNLTLDVTVNPDFGQVEADPAQVNLSAFETFLPERRPFFSEGANIFRFGLGVGDGDGAAESLFYSRRIGRAPQGGVSAGGAWVDRDPMTRILGAAKLSGKTDGGWSIGVLNALTGEAGARSALPEGVVDRHAIEPMTNYFVGRLQRDFREGGSAVGAVFTATHRDRDVADDLLLRRQAHAGGFDFRHRFGGDRFQVRGYVLGSRVAGSEEAMLATQRSSARYFQRPDAEHVELEERTSLSGHAGVLEMAKTGGGFWRFASWAQWRSPGFEANDAGFMTSADFASTLNWVGYHHSRPTRRFRNYSVNANQWASWNFGGDRIGLGGNVNGYAMLHNHWGAYGGINRNASVLSTTVLRGGPALRTEARWNGWFGAHTDARRPLQMEWNNNWGWAPESDSWNVWTSSHARWRPSARSTLRAGPFVSRNVNDRQWVGRVRAGGEDHYLVGRLEQTTVGMTLRADLALTPDLTLQYYGQPFLSAGGFGDYKRLAEPRAARYEDRFAGVETVETAPGVRGADLTGDGALETFPAPDFNVKQFRSNLVLRWEYRAGSTVYLVWAQARDHFEGASDFGVRRGLDRLFGEPADNVFMVKMSYWMNP